MPQKTLETIAKAIRQEQQAKSEEQYERELEILTQQCKEEETADEPA